MCQVIIGIFIINIFMGQIVSQFVKSFDNADKKKANAKEAMDALTKLAQSKRDLWLAQIQKGVGQNMKKMFADTLIDTVSSTMVLNKKGDGIGPAVNDILQGFTNKSLIQGISNTISKIVGKFIQTTQSGEMKEEGYKVILGPMGSVGRIDYFFYQYTFKNLGLQETQQSVFLYSYVHSAVNIDKVDNVNAFKVLIDTSYKDLTVAERREMLEEIYRGLDKALTSRTKK